MPAEHCYHVKENGIYCQHPALRGRRHCYIHLRVLGRRMRMARERARRQSLPLVLPLLEDMDSVMLALTQVLDARADARISEDTTGLMLYGLQQAASNVKWMEEKAAAEGEASGERVEEYPGFEAEFGLPENFDLEQPPEVAFPPRQDELPERPELSPYRDPAHAWQTVAPEDVELEELYKTGNHEAYKQRRDELMGQSGREADEHRRKVAEARWIVEAERRNRAIMRGEPIDKEAHEREEEAIRARRAELAAAKKAAEPAETTAPGTLQPQQAGDTPHDGAAKKPAEMTPTPGSLHPQPAVDKTQTQVPIGAATPATRPQPEVEKAPARIAAEKKPPKPTAAPKPDAVAGGAGRRSKG